MTTDGAPTELVQVLTTDLVAITRGRSVAADDPAAWRGHGVGWVPANLALTPFGDIASPNPWGSAGDLPTDLALWLIGLGVVPDWNPPRQPWLNPKVERNNGVTQRWVEISDCPDHATLRDRLAWAGRMQRELYPARDGRTRLETYPELTRILRPYSVETEPDLWQLSRVDAFLAGRSWDRRADRYGTIWVYNRGRCLGKAHAGKAVQVEFAPVTRHWVVTDASDSEPLAGLLAPELTRERIMSLDVSHRRSPRKK